MKKVLLDTNAYSRFKQNDGNVVSILQSADIIGINTIVLGELLAGFEGGKFKKNNLKELDRFLNSSRVEVHPIDIETTRYYATIYTLLKKKGKPIPTNDLWIAATALKNSFYLCTFDKHFQNIDDLIIVQSETDFLF